MKLNNIKYTLAICALLLTSVSYAQNPTDPKKATPAAGTLTDEIVVERPYKPVLADAAKIRRSPDLNSNSVFKRALTYSMFDKKLELNSDIRQLQAQEVINGERPPLLNNYAKFGMGNFSTGLAELYLNTGSDEALQAGFFLKHLNQKGDITGQKYSRQNAGIFGKSILPKVTLNGELGFDRFSTFLYGVDPSTNLTFNSDPQKQRYSTISIKGEMLKNYKSEDELDYAVKADAYFLSDKFDAKENAIALSGFVNKVWNDFNIGVNSSLDFTQTKDSLNIGNHIFRANPYIKLQGKSYKLSLGVNLVEEFGTNSGFNLFPTVTAEMPVIPEFATLFAGYTGDVIKSTLQNFSNENPYLNQNLQILNTQETANLYGGIKGNAGAGFGYKATLFYKKLDNMPLFVNNALNPERFDVIYDNAKVTGLEGEINVKVSDAFSWLGKVMVNNYSMDVQEKAWLKPEFKISSSARLSITKEITIDGELVLNDASSALVYLPTPSIVKVKGYADVSAGAEYVHKEKVGIFLRVNNMLNNDYQRLLYYPQLGLNVIGGVNYSF
ncbi:putative TonB-dependent receptor [Arcticibacter svalbardensis MN12-7]|uniref:Putative TonB-dependent receptor n=1 Tax=Arcticibacter svalbardensis MN12-7 TaxID=1150600 RepID=R9GYM7_9SPHI|nr:TonB-dependent receptor [Arcticibacter svalbardensis]EOR96590.1 putative TonB-dependent receptor [Arcticibacter svalbardensis MN12-7]